jgi:hypothetical protein
VPVDRDMKIEVLEEVGYGISVCHVMRGDHTGCL